ncbi:YbaB/EbfC family nucleoid-associated protein [Nakamurella endophytica]|uniref:Nucleoid-associated protein GCM10011594_27510 n=1 Tax=Nakamurella endophytica TaxID=1748367 RepID=A0A917WI33_9ACTN|nr:YbaB/EbfC family nucleoid-associated protein [Nakamurella endophytica]GGM05797.1 hypothetical protein GCM10011594_27510 [Nakamurella endophytica]
MQPGIPDLRRIVLKAQQMQAEVERTQAALADAEVTGHAGGGLVTATVSGEGELRQVRIDPSVVDPSDVETLGDLVVAAVRDATRQAAELREDAMGAVTGDLAGEFDLSALGLPGFGPGPGGVVDASPAVPDTGTPDDRPGAGPDTGRAGGA